MAVGAAQSQQRLALGGSLVLTATLAWCLLVYAAWSEASAIQAQAADGGHVPRRLGEMAAVRVEPTPVETKRFTVTLNKPPGEVLGIHLLWDFNANGLRVANVMANSHVARWNAKNPSQKVEAGDLLLSINGKSGSQEKLMTEMRRFGDMALVVQKQAGTDVADMIGGSLQAGRESATLLKTQPRKDPAPVPDSIKEFSIVLTKPAGSAFGLHLAHEANTMRIRSIDEAGLIAKWNAGSHGPKVLKGDLLVEVNGVSGDAQKILAECKKTGSMTLRFKRDGK